MKFLKEFDDKDCEKLKTMAAMGLPQKSMAQIMGISEITLERMIKHRVAVREAILNGRALGDVAVHQTVYSMATSGEHPAMTMFWLKVRCGWRETTNIHVTGGGGASIAIDDMSPEERRNRIQKLLDVRARLAKDVTPTNMEVIDVKPTEQGKRKRSTETE